MGTEWDTKDCLARAEAVRIRRIEKQLTMMKRNQYSTNSTRYLRSHSDYPLEAFRSLSKVTSTRRRRSSLDQQALDRWKELNKLSKPSVQLSRAIRKLMLRKFSRYSTKKNHHPLNIQIQLFQPLVMNK